MGFIAYKYKGKNMLAPMYLYGDAKNKKRLKELRKKGFSKILLD